MPIATTTYTRHYTIAPVTIRFLLLHFDKLNFSPHHTEGERLKLAGIAVVALPASDLCMMGRNDNGNKRRGVCPVDKLLNLGVNATYATNNIQNLFTFTGDGDVLKVGTLLCQILQLTSENGGKQCIEMITEIAAKALGVKHSLNENNYADMVILGDGILSPRSCMPCTTSHTTSASSTSSSLIASYSTLPPSLSEKIDYPQSESQSEYQQYSNDKSSLSYSETDTNTSASKSSHNNVPSAMKIFSAPPVDRIVIKRGRIVSETTLHRTLYK